MSTLTTKRAPWRDNTLTALARLESLSANWDSYGSPPIQPAALQSARRLVSAIEIANLPTPAVAPISGGGLGLAWQLRNRELELEILPDGSVQYLAVASDPAAGTEETREGRLPQLFTDQVRELVAWLAQA